MRSSQQVACVALALTFAVLACQTPALAQRGSSIPPFVVVESTIRQFFATKKYETNTILSRGDAEQCFEALKEAGWEVPNADKILARILPDDDYMVEQLREPVAKRFLDHIASYPEGFDRTDRMRQLPRGHIFLHDLIRNPGGFRLIQYMTTPPLGTNLGKQIENTPKGKDFNDPTKRLYTVDQLVACLKKVYNDPAMRVSAARR